MANEEHLFYVNQEYYIYKSWKDLHPNTPLDLSEANLSGANLSQIDLNGANLSWADLDRTNLQGNYITNANMEKASLRWANLSNVKFIGVNLTGANLTGADLIEADLHQTNCTEAWFIRANLIRANLSGSNLFKAHLQEANLNYANLKEANLIRADLLGAHLASSDLSGADLSEASLVASILINANLESANLNSCQIHGISCWDLKINKETKQSGLIISNSEEAEVTVDDIEIAQFIYLLLNRKKLRNVLETITSKAVLILGRFTPERKVILDSLANELRKLNLLPIIFDFERATTRDITETITILAGLSKFVIADITDAKSIPQELSHIIPNFPSIPIKPIILSSQKEYSMFEHWEKFNSVLPVFEYDFQEHLIKNIYNEIVKQIEEWKIKQDEVLKLKKEIEELKIILANKNL
jgi:uncharacterized protein YjbI with pentapeptide repeats